MILRRDLLTGAAALTAIPRPGIAATNLLFNVIRNDSDIGQHKISFHADGDLLVANVTVEIVVRLGPIPLYRYTHSVRETWLGDRFISLDSETIDDGKHFRVHAIRIGDQVVIETEAARRAVVSPETIPLTHWNRLCMERPLFNPQDGVPIASKVVALGEEMVALASGTMVRATHYSLVGTIALEDWYDAANQWTALRTIGRDGSRIEYRRVA
jgi:Family of unknown function (DUF6134)